MADKPCLNPNCKSHGMPHPNCRCYMAKGGMVECKGPHKPDCQYYKGGSVNHGKISLDLKKFKHVRSGANSTTLRHNDGHELTIAHNALSPESQGQLKALAGLSKEAQTPLQADAEKHKMYDGGDVNEFGRPDIWKTPPPPPPPPAPSTQPNNRSPARNQKNYEMLRSGKYTPQQVQADEKANPMAEGGKILRDNGKIPMHQQSYAEGDKVEAPQSLTGQLPPDIGGVSDITGVRPGAIPAPSPEDQTKSKLQDIINKGPEAISAAHNMMFGSPLDMQAPQKYKPYPIPSEANAEAPAMAEAPKRIPASVEQSDEDVDKEVNQASQMQQEPQQGVPTHPISHADQPLRPDGTFGPNQQQAPQQPAAPASPTAPTFEDHKQNTLNELQQEDQAWQHDLVNGHITPKTYSDLFHDKRILGKIGTIFGLLLSGAGSGLAKQPNAMLAMMNNEIANDLEGQKQSKQNAQNFLRITQDNMMKKSQAAQLDADTAQKSFALTRMHENYAALHYLTEEVKKMPEGSPQRQQAETTLAMLNTTVQNENFNLADRASAASAYYKMVLGNQGESENPAIAIRKKSLVGAITPAQADAALKEVKHVEDHVQINQNALDSFDKVAKMATISSKLKNPIQNKRQIEAEWSPMMDKLTKDTEGRVTPITVDLMSSLRPEVFDNPETLQIKRQKLNAILNAGFATPALDSINVPIHKGPSPAAQNQQSTPQYKTDKNGVRWMRGPNGEAIRVN